MENYEIGLIFIDDEDYSNKAKWCNENNAFIEEIEPDENGVRQFQIKEIVVPEKTAEEQIAEITVAVQKYLDSAVQVLNYDNGFACASYATSSEPKFRKEAESYILWRDKVWTKCYALLDEYEVGEIAMPSVEEVLSSLPKFEILE